MKIKAPLLAVSLFALVFFAFASNANAQIGGPKTGAYKEISTDDSEAQAAADFAIKKNGENENLEITLQEILKAESQVVAGVNYRLCLKVAVHAKDSDEADEIQTVQVVVYKNLQRQYKLTSWTAAECGEN